MATAVSVSQLDGYFKIRYGELQKTQPDFALLSERIPFVRQAKLGKTYNFPVQLTRSHGITWNGATTVGNAFTLNNPSSLTMDEAAVPGSEFLLREQISYGAISRGGSGPEAFGPTVDTVAAELFESSAFYREMAILYGGTNIGVVESGGGTANLVITLASWAPGLWAQMEGAYLNALTSNFATQRTTTAGGIQVTVVNADTRTVTVTGADSLTVVNGDVLVPFSAQTTTAQNWFSGLDKIITNTGTLFGIDAAAFSMWKGNTYSASTAALTMSKLQAAATKAVVRGLLEKVTAVVSTMTWTDLMNDTVALRRFAESTKSSLDLGTQNITFYGANGEMEVMPHPMVKASEAFIVPLRRVKRIGSSDTTFNLPDAGDDRFVRQIENSAGIEVRAYFDQAICITHPARTVKVTGIVNTSLPS